MKIFVIEAYGGVHADGPICHFTVRAETPEEALDFVQRSAKAKMLDRLELVEETPDFEADINGIISEEEGPYVKPL
ncbi:MAG: hypothetical protein ACOY3L_14595 [Pseudomonadota bacterium]